MIISKQDVSYRYGYGSDLEVVNAARVSYNKHSDQFKDSDAKLLEYLAKHQHWSPFAHVGCTLYLKAPIFVARQLVKHQVGLVWNEVSRRYVDNEPEFYIPEVFHGRPIHSKQGSGDALDAWTQRTVRESLTENSQQSLNVYNSMLSLGVAPEEARLSLPLNTMTEWVWTGSLYAWHRVLTQRLDSHAQIPTREIAKLIYACVEPHFPVSIGVLRKNGGY